MGLWHSEQIRDAIQASMAQIEAAWTAPHVLLRPRVYPDGNAWCCLLGDDLMSGVVGFGDTPQEAAKAFDDAWRGILHNVPED